MLLVLVLMGGVAAFATLAFIGRGGAVSGEVSRIVMERLLKIYVPLLGLIGSFYFSEHGLITRRGRSTATEAFLLSTFITFAWVFLPSVLIAASETVEAGVRTLDTLDVYGSTLAVGALGFYFSKTAPDRSAV